MVKHAVKHMVTHGRARMVTHMVKHVVKHTQSSKHAQARTVKHVHTVDDSLESHIHMTALARRGTARSLLTLEVFICMYNHTN